MSSSGTPPKLPDGYLDLWAVRNTPSKPLVQLVKSAPVETIYIAHRGSTSIDVRVTCRNYFVTAQQIADLPGVWGAPIAYQFFVNPEHEAYAAFDGFEWVGRLEDAKVHRDFARDAFEFYLERTFGVNLPTTAVPPTDPTLSTAPLTMDMLVRSMRDLINASGDAGATLSRALNLPPKKSVS